MKEYRSSIRSKKFIREAFAKILSEKKDIGKVTVKEIIERADISKSTFYAHYEDIYAVIEEFENEIIVTIKETIDEYDKKHIDEFMPYIDHIIALLKENDSLYRMLLSSDDYQGFIYKIKKILMERIDHDNKLVGLPTKKAARAMTIDFLANGIIYLFVDYYKGYLPITLNDIKEEIIRVCRLLLDNQETLLRLKNEIA